MRHRNRTIGGNAADSAVEVTELAPSGDNVFALFGLPEPEERQAKSDIAIQIWREVKRRKLTQADAARVTGLTQPQISCILRGRLSGFSTDRLLECLNSLGKNVEIRIYQASEGQPAGIKVVAANNNLAATNNNFAAANNNFATARVNNLPENRWEPSSLTVRNVTASGKAARVLTPCAC